MPGIERRFQQGLPGEKMERTIGVGWGDFIEREAHGSGYGEFEVEAAGLLLFVSLVFPVLVRTLKEVDGGHFEGRRQYGTGEAEQ